MSGDHFADAAAFLMHRARSRRRCNHEAQGASPVQPRAAEGSICKYLVELHCDWPSSSCWSLRSTLPGRSVSARPIGRRSSSRRGASAAALRLPATLPCCRRCIRDNALFRQSLQEDLAARILPLAPVRRKGRSLYEMMWIGSSGIGFDPSGSCRCSMEQVRPWNGKMS